MTLLRRGLRVIAVAVVTVAVGVAVNQVLNGGRWDVRWLAAAIALAAVAEGLDVWLGKRDGARPPADEAVPVLWSDLAGEDGFPLPLSEVTPRDLGVHPSRFGRDGDSPYIPRAADSVLAAALTDAGSRVVIVQGLRLAGATSTLAQAAQSCLPDCLAAGFIDDPRVSLEDMIAQAGRWAADPRAAGAGIVVWLDGLTPARLAEFARIPLGDLPTGVRLLATLDSGELDGLRIPEQLNALLDRHTVRVELGAVTDEERRALLAEDAYAALRPLLSQQDDLFIGRAMVAWEPLRAALTRGGSEQSADRVALLRAVTDWYRVHLPRLLSGDVLAPLYRAYRRELAAADADRPVSASAYSEALRWATAGPAVDRPRLIDLQDVSGGQQYAPHPLLAVLADDPGEAVAWPVSDALWSYADRFFDGDQRRDIGYTALSQSARHAAARLLSHTDTTIDPAAYNQLAVLFYRSAEWRNARHWYQQAIAAGHTDSAPRAMVNLGYLEEQQGNLDQARHWYQQAIATGHAEAAGLAHQEIRALDRRQDGRRRGEEFGRYGYLAYADPALMKPGEPATTPDSDQAVDDDKGTVLQTALEHALTCTATAARGRFGTHSAHAEPDGFAVIAGL
jgi:tetratricopeptide (TPR) repeat protein